MLIVLLILLPILWFVYTDRKYSKMRKEIAHTQGPKTLPLIGNVHQLAKTPNAVVHFMFDNWYKYGQGNYRVWVGYYLHMMIGDPKDVEFILSSNTLIAKSKVYDMLHPWLGDGLLTSKGSKWHKHRKIITPSFHFKILQDFHDVMNSNSTKFIDKLMAASKDGKIFDFQHYVNHLTLDVICETAMGISINALDNPNSEFAKAVEFMCGNINMRALNPLKRKIATYQFFPDYKDYCKALAVLKDFTYGVIERRIELLNRKRTQKSNAEPEDEFTKRKMAFLDTLLSTSKDGSPFSTQELYEEVSTFIFEGHDTTSSAISFAVFLLSRHLGIQKKVYEEQQRIMGDDLKRSATFQEISEMKYLDMVVKEALRLFPTVPVVGRHTEKEYNMNGKIIPEDTSLNIFLLSLGYNEKVFPDPYRFDPERFDPSNNGEVHKPFEYVPFSAGPRNCIGQKFALLEVKTVISKVVRYFEILPALDELESKDGYVCTYFGPYRHQKPPLHKYDPKVAAMLTLKSDNGILLRLKERK
uniref:Cytochrome P450 n=1 Tax=Stomoxys calcitrans TaxID=35570 RepID=A0A1I8P7U7_STOCA